MVSPSRCRTRASPQCHRQPLSRRRLPSRLARRVPSSVCAVGPCALMFLLCTPIFRSATSFTLRSHLEQHVCGSCLFCTGFEACIQLSHCALSCHLHQRRSPFLPPQQGSCSSSNLLGPCTVYMCLRLGLPWQHQCRCPALSWPMAKSFPIAFIQTVKDVNMMFKGN